MSQVRGVHGKGINMKNLELQKILQYEGNLIEINGKGMWNATQMAKPFGDSKRPSNWINLESTKEYLSILSKDRNLSSDNLVTVVKGGENSGTWIHEKLVIKFAQWLNTRFELWCNEQIEVIIRKGVPKVPLTYKESLLLLIEKEEENERLASEVEAVKSLKEELEIAIVECQVIEKLDFIEIIFAQQDLLDMSEVVKILDLSFGRNTLFEILREKKILMQARNEPRQEYVNKGYFVYKFIYPKAKAGGGIYPRIYVTKKGMYFLNNLIDKLENETR